jgi:hypothetical protein
VVNLGARVFHLAPDHRDRSLFSGNVWTDSHIRSVRPRLSRTIQGPKSQPESCFGRMCLSPEKRLLLKLRRNARQSVIGKVGLQYLP